MTTDTEKRARSGLAALRAEVALTEQANHAIQEALKQDRQAFLENIHVDVRDFRGALTILGPQVAAALALGEKVLREAENG